MNKKFPRIPHLPWSPGGTNDDKRLPEYIIPMSFLGVGNTIVVTEKLDGSNLCLTRDEIFARSHSGPPTHSSFDLAKFMHAQIRGNIPDGVDVFGEWCYAVHSIEYDSLPGPFPFFVFGVREGEWWTWHDVEDLAANLGVNTAPVLFVGVVDWNFKTFTETLSSGKSIYGPEKEGIVVWPYHGMANDDDFAQQTAKWVRSDHPKNPDEHWMFKPIKKQGVIV